MGERKKRRDSERTDVDGAGSSVQYDAENDAAVLVAVELKKHG